MKDNKGKNNIRQKQYIRSVTSHGMLVAMAIVLSWLEAQIPAFFAVPGMKLGITNIVVVTALYKMSSPSAMGINILRIILVSFMFGGPSAMIYSLSGGMLSTLIMILLKKIRHFSITAVSIAGGVFHNIGQVAAAAVILNTDGIFWYLSVLWFTGMVTGTLIGILSSQLVKRLPDSLFSLRSGGTR